MKVHSYPYRLPRQLHFPKPETPPVNSALLASSETPGLIIDINEFLKNNPIPGFGLSGNSYFFYLNPPQVEIVFDKTVLLDLLKLLLKEGAKQIHPHGGAVVGGAWIAIGGAIKLFKPDLFKPDIQPLDTVFTVAGLALGIASTLGDVYPDLKVPNGLSKSMDLFVKTGEVIITGEPITTIDLALMDKQNEQYEIPLTLMKVLKIASDPKYPTIKLPPLVPPIEPQDGIQKAKNYLLSMDKQFDQNEHSSS